jgi:two-component system cell cycle response regulator
MPDSSDRTLLSDSIPWEQGIGKRLPVLIVLRGGQLGRRYLLNEHSLVLGRRETRSTIVIPSDPEISGAHCRIQYNAERDVWMIADLRSTNGTWVNGERVRGAQLHDGDKILLGQTILKFTFHDVIEAQFYQDIDRMMNFDELTNLAVLRLFNERFRQALDSCAAEGKPLAVLMMDMDGLKHINDTYGHHIGAQTIRAAGHLLGSIIQPQGLVTRFGGDEFTAFSVGHNRAQGLALGEFIRTTIKTQPFEFDGIRVYPTMSIGVAAFPQDGDTCEKLTRRADEALYRAKAAGRDCVRD